jgi:hypothetical protein
MAEAVPSPSALASEARGGEKAVGLIAHILLLCDCPSPPSWRNEFWCGGTEKQKPDHELASGPRKTIFLENECGAKAILTDRRQA